MACTAPLLLNDSKRAARRSPSLALVSKSSTSFASRGVVGCEQAAKATYAKAQRHVLASRVLIIRDEFLLLQRTGVVAGVGKAKGIYFEPNPVIRIRAVRSRIKISSQAEKYFI